MQGMGPTFVVYQAVPVEVCQTEHLTDILLAQILPQPLHDVPQFVLIDETVTVHVENLGGGGERAERER